MKILHGAVELLISRMGLWRARGGELAQAWACGGGSLMPPQPTPSLEWVCLLLDLHCPFCHSTSWDQSPSTGPQKHLWLLEGNSAGPLSLHRPGQAMCLESSHHSSVIQSSCCTLVNTLGTTAHLPL